MVVLEVLSIIVPVATAFALGVFRVLNRLTVQDFMLRRLIREMRDVRKFLGLSVEDNDKLPECKPECKRRLLFC